MSAPNVCMQPAAGAATCDFDATESDKIMVSANGAGLAGAETILIFIKNTGTTAVGAGADNGSTTIYDSTGAAASLTSTRQSVMLEGGFWYYFKKSVTGGAVGIDIMVKRAQGA